MKAVSHEACPRCRERGQDRRGDNCGVYPDGGAYCFSCGYSRRGKFSPVFNTEEKLIDEEKAVLPSDFTRQIPAEGWKWLLQYGLPYSYWKNYCGYSEKENRLVITNGDPIFFSQGRALTMGDKPKWRNWGTGHSRVEVHGSQLSGPIVLVEDIISVHKIAQLTQAICLFGTNIHDAAIAALQAAKRPVVVWLDADQYQLLPKKLARLQSLLRHPVSYVSTELDPKSCSFDFIKEQLHV